MKKITILHTGGTIASKVDYTTGGVSNLSSPEELLAQYPELQEIAQVKARFIANMSSDDMRFWHWNALSKAASEALSDCDGIIITHGTDTLHYTAIALHYALLGTPVPIVLVGSQRSSDRGSSDAAQNLLGAARYIADDKALPGVFVAMHQTSSDSPIAILRAINSRKMHSSRRDAFKNVNNRLAALVHEDSVELVEPPKPQKEFSLTKFKEGLRIGMCYAHPNMHAQELACYDGYDALILLGTGLGHFPINSVDDATKEHGKIQKALAKLAKKLPVVMSTQAIYGRINLEVYSAGRKHQELGVLGHGLGFTPETLFVKTAWLLSQGLDVKKHLGADYGDVVERTAEDAYE
jgi:glutamyl-tRNA(Gln) amidotransferase subunit D